MATTHIAIAGLGTNGRALARSLANGVPGLELTGVAVRDHHKAESWLRDQGIACPILALRSLPDYADLAVEAAPADVLEAICRPMLLAGKIVMVVSAGALLPKPELVELARDTGGQIIVPTGALLGLDAVTAAAEGSIRSVRLTTRKPPRGLAGAPYLKANDISVEGLDRPFCVPRQRQRGGRSFTGGDRARSNNGRDLGGSRRLTQLSHDRCRRGLG